VWCSVVVCVCVVRDDEILFVIYTPWVAGPIGNVSVSKKNTDCKSFHARVLKLHLRHTLITIPHKTTPHHTTRGQNPQVFPGRSCIQTPPLHKTYGCWKMELNDVLKSDIKKPTLSPPTRVILTRQMCIEAAREDWRRLRKVYKTGKGCWRTVDWKRGGKARSNIRRSVFRTMQHVEISDEIREVVEDILVEKLRKPGYETHESYIRCALIPNFFDALIQKVQSNAKSPEPDASACDGES